MGSLFLLQGIFPTGSNSSYRSLIYISSTKKHTSPFYNLPSCFHSILGLSLKSAFSIFISSVSKESACNAGDPGLIPGLGRSPGEGNGNPLQCYCPKNPMDRGAWQATVHGVARVGHNLVAKERERELYINLQIPSLWTVTGSYSSSWFHLFHNSCPKIGYQYIV